MARVLRSNPHMTESFTPQADAFLLLLDEGEFLDIAAMIGLRARPTAGADSKIIEEFLESELADSPLDEAGEAVLLGYLPDLPPQ